MTAGAGGLDPVIHAAARLRIMVTLNEIGVDDNLTFARLQELLGLTAGNLITHLRKLEDAGYVETSKNRRRGGHETTVRLTTQGRAAFESYRRTLSAMLGEG